MPVIEYKAERTASVYDAQVAQELAELVIATQANADSATQVKVPTVDADKFITLFQTAANDKGFTARVRLRKDDGKFGKDNYTKGKRAGLPIPTGETELILSLTNKYAPGRGRKAAVEPVAE